MTLVRILPMLRLAARSACLLAAFITTATLAQQGSIYDEPGIYKNRSYISYHPAEHIDPFTGRLQLHHVDLVIPGNGGLDIKIQRSYNSLQIDGTSLPTAGIVGIGWDLHFGRLRIPQVAGISCTPSSWGASVGTNPTLELPDGSSHIIYTAISSYLAGIGLTKSFWKGECGPGGVGMLVTSPDGVRYEMTQGAGAGLFLTQKIVDRHGNTLNFTYSTMPSLQVVPSSISSVDGDPAGSRNVSFSYQISGSQGQYQLASFTSGGRIYSYSYQPVAGFSALYYQLTLVNGPAGLTWQYQYNAQLANNVAGSFSLNRMTLPFGATVNYSYQYVQFASPLPNRTTSVSTKTSSGDAISAPGNWTFIYSPSTGNGILDQTTMTGPEGTTTWKHFGYNTIPNGDVWKLGLISQKSFGSLQTEIYTWDKKLISNQKDWRAAPYNGKSDLTTSVPVLITRQITRDGTAFTTNYPLANYDKYGNAGSISETGNNGTRSTTVTFYENTSLWVIKEWLTRTIIAPGIANATISRTFNASANLVSENKFGVATGFLWDGQGNLTQITDARSNSTTFPVNSRGVPTTENRPEAVGIVRTVDFFGNVLTERDGELFTTSFSYDGLNRLLSVAPAIGSSVAITWSFAGKSKSVSRGGISESTTFDGVGRPVSINRNGIARTMRYDALGRKVFESYPGSTLGTSYQFDILGRVTQVTHGDGNSRSVSFSSGNVETTTDEDNFSTSRTYRSFGDPDERAVTQISNPAVPAANVSMVRDGFSNITSVTQNGVTRSIGYDSRFFVTSMNEPERGAVTYGRDAVGNMTSRIVAGAAATNFTVDGLNRTTLIDYPGNALDVTKTYDKRSNLTKVSSSSAVRDLAYDGNGNLTQDKITVSGTPYVMGYSYNAIDQLNMMTYPSGQTVTFAPNALGRPTQAAPFVTSATYYPSGNLSQLQMQAPNSTVSNFTEQSNRQWLSGISVFKPFGANYVGLSVAYDPRGNPRQITDTWNTANNRSLQYDGLSRLTNASGPWGGGTMAYDGNGNLQSQFFANPAVTLTYSYTNSRLSSVATTGQPVRGIGYDVYGNVTSNGQHAFRYNDAQALDCVDCAIPALPGEINYFYDGLGNMVRSIQGGTETRYLYSLGGQLLGEYQPARGDFKREHFYIGGKRFAMRSLVTEVASSTAVTVTSPVPPAIPVFGQAVTLRAAVTGSTPTGTVAFKNGGVVIAGCESANLLTGVAICTTASLAAGTRSISATYSGDEVNLTSTSAPVNVVVNKASTSTVITTHLPSPSVPGQAVTITATVTAFAPGAGIPTGTTTISSGALSCPATLAAGTGSCAIAFPSVATYGLNAAYAGDANFLASNAAGVNHVVNCASIGQLDRDCDGIPDAVEATVSRNPDVKDNDIFSSAQLFAMQMYRDFLGREGDSGGIASWISYMNAGGTRAVVAEAFFGSAEFQDSGAPIARLYFAFFLRPPDYGGFVFQSGRYRTGTPLVQIANEFAASPEFTSLYGALDNTQYVTQLYRNVLNRDPSVAERDGWVAQLNAGASRGQVALGFSESPEFKAPIANEVYVSMMYIAMLRRTADTGGFNFWVGYMDQGNSGQALIGGFLSAAEYRNRFLP